MNYRVKFVDVTLGDCCEIISGSTPSRLINEYWNGDINWFTPKDLSGIKSKYVTASPEQITQSGINSCSAKLLPPKSLLLSSRAPIGHIAISTIEACTNQGFKSLVPNENVDVEYLFYAIKKIIPQLQDLGNGATFKEISKATLSRVTIPLPPLAEQQKIASILDAADSLRQKDQQLIEKYTALSQSLFLDIFGDPVINPKKWAIKAFGNSLIDIVGGKSVGGEQRQIKDNEKAVLKISAVTTGVFNSLEYKVVEGSELPETLVNPLKGNLLFSRANTRELVGATCIVDEDYEYLFLPDKLWRLDLKLDMASNWYLKFLLTHEGFRENLRKVATGTSGSMLNISKAKLKQLKIPLPPINLQNQFAERILAIEAQKHLALASLKKSEDLFNSLLQRAFNGELTA